MAETAAKVDWYGKQVLLAIEGASDELLGQLALQCEGEAKVGAPVDTGFMRNAIYAITPTASKRMQAEAETGVAADREMAPEPQIEAHEAALHAAAGYTIYQELRVGFIYGALEKVAKLAGGIVQQVAKRRGLI